MCRSLYRILLLCVLAIGTLFVFGTRSPAVHADPPPCADLVITDVQISSFVIQGQSTQIKITVKNQGTCESLSFTVQWKQDEVAQTGPSFNVDNLASGASTVVGGPNGFSYTFPTAGDFNTVATVDTDRTVDETNEANNVEIKPVTVYPDLPDLALAGFSITPEKPVQGIPAQIEITVENRGSKDAGPFVVQWKHGQLAPTGPSKQILGLAAGSSVNFAFQYAFPNAGDFTTIVNIDTDRTVAESNEDNNLGILATSVLQAAPDLVITDFQIVPVDPAPGFPLLPVEGLNARIDLTVLNQGNAPAGPFVVQWKSAQLAPTGPSRQVSGLGIGDETTVSFEYAFPNAGQFITQATVDTNQDVRESNESNNLQILSIEVQKAVIDLVIKSFKVVPAPGVDHSIPPPGADPNPVQNRLSEAVIVFANEGNFPAGDFKLAWKPGPIFEAEQTVQVNGLKYGESKSWTFQFIYRNAGEFNSTATVDSTNTVRESNEFNNSKTLKIVVEREQADLEILNFEIVPSQPVQGIAAKAVITIRNRGNTAAGPFDVEWRATQFAAPQRTQVVAGLGVHDTVQVKFDHTYGFARQFNSTVAVDAPIGRVAELDETNNSASLQVTVQQATKNLVINDIQILPLENEGCSALNPRSVTLVEPELDQNQDYFVCIKIQNLGNSPVGPFVVSWNPDTFNLSVPSLNTLTKQVDLIGPGAEMTVQFVFAYPQAGEFRSIAEVDAFKVIAETNEQDNLRILNVVVNATGPDLVITELEVQPYYGYEYEGDLFDTSGLVRAPEIIRDRETCIYNEDQVGAALARAVPPPYDPDYTAQLTEDQVARVCIKVLNKGNRAAGPFVIDWNPDSLGLSTPSPATISVHVPEQQNDPNWLRSDQFVIVEFYYVYVAPGTYRSVAKADSHNHVAELNEQNNLALRNIDVSGDMADLRITGMKIVNLEQQGPRSTQAVNCNAAAVSTNGTQEPQLTQGVRYGICITIQNAGSREAGDFVLSWNPDALGLIVPNVATLTTQVTGLSSFESRTIPFEFTYEQNGEFRSIAEVDAFKVIPESNEDNNKDILNVVVAVAPIDLSITSFTINPSSPTRGSKATATITVRNNSDYPTKAFSVQWKLTGEEGSGPSTRIQGLLPFQSETVELEGTFFIAGDYTSLAIVDVSNEIPETNENNNKSTRAVTAQKRVTQVRVTFNRLEVITAFEDGIDGNAEWINLVFVVDPSAEDGFRQARVDDNAVEDGDNIGLNKSFDITLEEFMPVALASASFEVDDFLGIPTDGKFTGATVAFWTLLDRWGEGQSKTASIEGPCSNGRCFDLVYTIEVLSEPPPLTGLSIEETKAAIPTVVLSKSIPMPSNTVMPAGIILEEGSNFVPNLGNKLYLPTVNN